MPELPEVETVRRGLLPVFENGRIERVEVRRPDLRRPFPPRFAARLAGRTIERLDRRAKYLLAVLDDGAMLLIHLGMSGSLRIDRDGATAAPGAYYRERSKAAAHDHVVFHMRSGARVTYNDPRRFGLMDLFGAGEAAASPLLAGLGVEPLGPDFDGAVLARLLAGRTAPVKAALLDQRLIAGLGNIYVCEALWRARLSPLRAAGSIGGAGGRATAASTRLVTAIRAVLEEAIEAGGSSLRDHVGADGELGSFQHRFCVYDREGEPCPRPGCRGIVTRITQAGRSTFFCTVCQK